MRGARWMVPLSVDTIDKIVRVMHSWYMVLN